MTDDGLQKNGSGEWGKMPAAFAEASALTEVATDRTMDRMAARENRLK